MGSERAGYYVNQLYGDLSYKAFIPKPLPPEPPVMFDSELTKLLSEADQAVGRLDGIIKNIPNPDLFVLMYTKKEAVLSSQIEGTQASLSDILEKEEDILSDEKDDDVRVTLNYIEAAKYGLERIKELPLSLRLIREMHQRLLTNVRGHYAEPGEFRKTQNWVGPGGCTLKDATYVPPPVHEMNEALGQWEKYLHSRSRKKYPILIDCGLIHSQFETIHPFSDGNGRIGRLLITLLLCLNGIISGPVLYLSYHFKKNRREYYDKLNDVRDSGNWENWLKFFLKGVSVASDNAVELSNRIMQLKKKNEELVRKNMRRFSGKTLDALNTIYIHPVFTINKVKETERVSYNTAKAIIKTFKNLNIIEEKNDRKRDRKYYFREYINLLNEGTELR